MTTTTRPKRCIKEGCKAPAAKGRRGKCMAHYLDDYRAGEVGAKADDLGPDAKRVEFEAPADLVRRFHEAVPAGERRRVLRRALEAELQRMEAQPDAPEVPPCAS